MTQRSALLAAALATALLLVPVDGQATTPDGSPVAASGPSVVLTPAAAAVQAERERAARERGSDRGIDRGDALLLGGAAAGLLAYGYAVWWQDGFDWKFKQSREGWFGKFDSEGGIDKAGHFFSNYAGVRMLTPLLQAMGNERDFAVKVATLATAAAFVGVEVLDGFSREYRFSKEDAIMNVLGATAGYLTETYPALDRLVTFRLGYRKELYSDTFDPLGDYEGQRYLMVFKAEGVPGLRDIQGLKYLEASIGYGIYGYRPDDFLPKVRQREVYLGVSVNLGKLIGDGFYGGQRRSTRWQTAMDVGFDLFQLPVGVWNRRVIK